MFPELSVELKTKERLFGALLAKSNDEGLMWNEFRGRSCPQPITGSYQLRSVLTALRAVLGTRKRSIGDGFSRLLGTLAFAGTLKPTSGSRNSLLAMGDQRDLDLFLSSFCFGFLG